MNCRKAEKQLEAYAAGVLSQPGLGELEEHLSKCARCRSEGVAAQRLETAIESIRGVDDRLLQDRIRDGIRRPGSSPRLMEKHMKTRKLTITVGLATALCAAGLVGALTLTPTSAMATLKRSIKAVRQGASAK